MIFSTMSPADILKTETAFPEMQGRIPLSLYPASYSTIFLYGQMQTGITSFASIRVCYDVNRISVFYRSADESLASFFGRVARSGAVWPVLSRNIEWISIQKCDVKALLIALSDFFCDFPSHSQVATLELNPASSNPFDFFDFEELMWVLKPSKLSLYMTSQKNICYAEFLREFNNVIPVSILFSSDKIKREVKAVLGKQLVE